ncbi:hypothetical protein JRQ81_013365, partial [Phrynocephalus forsythii]
MEGSAPGAKVVWSTIIPRQCWGRPSNEEGLNWPRRGVNWEVSRYVLQIGGAVVGHPGIGKAELFRPDGVHLMDAGLNIFLEDLRKGCKL